MISRKFISLSSIVLTVVLLAMLVSPCSSSTPAKSSINGYELSQYHSDRGGIIVDLSPQGIKIFVKKSGLVTVSVPPDWNVIAYSARTRKIFFTDLPGFKGEDRIIFAATGNPVFTDIPIKKVGLETLSKIPVEMYTSTPEFAKQQMIEYHSKGATGDFPSKIYYGVSPTLALRPEFGTLMTRLYGSPKTNGVPIELTYEGLDLHKYTLFTTQECHPRTFTRADFKIPVGFHKVQSLAEVQADLTDQNEAETLINSFDDTRPRPSADHHN